MAEQSTIKDRGAAPEHGLRHILYLFILGMLCAFGPMCTDIYLPALPDITRHYGADPSAVQLSLTASFAGLALGQIFIGPISDAYGRKIPLLVSLLVFALTSFMCAVAPNIHLLVLWRVFQGMAGAGGLVLSRSIACDRFRGPALTSFMSVLMTINSVAPILGPLLGSFIITYFSWQVVFFFLCGWGVLLLILSTGGVPESHFPKKEERHIAAAVGGMFKELKNRTFLLYTLSLSFVSGAFFAYLSASPFVFQVIYGYTPLQFSLVFGANSVVMSVAAIIAGRLAVRAGDAWVVKLAYSVMISATLAVLICAFIVPAHSWWVLLCLMFFCATMSSSQTAGFSLVMNARTGGAGAATGIFGVMSFVFGSLTSPFMGVMGENSMVPLGVCMFGCTIMAILMLWWAQRTQHAAGRGIEEISLHDEGAPQDKSVEAQER
ncbi:MAG: multidrug effflux MFS transporter [Succinivibrio sp.]|nr:multidrug effflux MFS transporter [Succinivibrio sp.]